MARRFEIEISDEVWRELERRRLQSGNGLSGVVEQTLREALDLDQHTLFQVSTSNALAQGVFAGAVTVGTLKEHGDFGIGTFDQLDGELILIDGVCHRATAGGELAKVEDEVTVPFAAVTHFTADARFGMDGASDLDDLHAALNEQRASDNVFQGMRVSGRFKSLHMRAACRALPGEGLLEATRHQSEFTAADIDGTLIGFWAPDYAHTVGIPGYHFHFISNDREIGGHLLDFAASDLSIEVQTESSIHLAMPDTPQFRSADLAGDHRNEIDEAETERRSGD